MLKMKKNNLIEIQTAYSEIFISAVKFFESAGVIFTDSRRDHRHGLCILIDDSLATPVCINAFMFAMSRNALAGFYAHIIKGEKIGGPRRIQSLIKVINGLIKEGYSKGHQISHNLETGKYRLKGTEVLGIAMDIFERAFTYSLGGDTLRHMGDIYSLLGGETGTKAFFKEVMLATEASIPELEDETVHHPICGIPQINVTPVNIAGVTKMVCAPAPKCRRSCRHQDMKHIRVGIRMLTIRIIVEDWYLQ